MGAPIAAEKTATGYEVAWKAMGTDQYTVWNTDNNGNYISDIGVVSGNSPLLQAFETSFHQDLNGDGRISPPATVLNGHFGQPDADRDRRPDDLDRRPKRYSQWRRWRRHVRVPAELRSGYRQNFTPGTDALRI